MNLANNHALDYGDTGQAETIAALKRAGLRFTGRPGEIAVMRHGGTKVAFVGFAPYPWAQDLLDIKAAVKLVRKANRKADVVVVTMHAGAEGSDEQHVRPGPEWFLGEPRGNVVAFSHAVVRAGADLVVGHGPHVLRGIEWYRGRVIAYSLGNFLGNGTLNVSGVTGQTAVLRATLRRDGSWESGKLVPIRLSAGGLPRVDSRQGRPFDLAQALACRLRAQRRSRLSVRDAAAARLAHRLRRARRPALRHGHVPLHGRRGLDEVAPRARRRRVRRRAGRAPPRDPRCLRRARAASRWTRRATRSSSPSRRLPAARRSRTGDDRGARRRARSACVPGCTPGRRSLAEEGYVGDDVHRAARIAAAGHGGQVLVSAATASLVELELTDLGEHRFKDLGCA